MLIGLDFDNTIVSYDKLMGAIAAEWALVPESTVRSKRQIRDALRAAPNGELAWQRLQVAAYGTRINEAEPAQGVTDFLAQCKKLRVPVCIVSHKTIHPNLDGHSVNLREAALGWLELHGFFDELGIARTAVYFESTRTEKIARIAQLGITHFVDDLEETFSEPSFPAHVKKILYSGEGPSGRCAAAWCRTWDEVGAGIWRDTEPAMHAYGTRR
jgi:hypothetical protein